jgi:predicted transcriptional regulator
MTAKERVKALLDNLPDDATYEQIMRELAFGEMVDRGLEDSRGGNTLSNEGMKKRIDSWQK